MATEGGEGVGSSGQEKAHADLASGNGIEFMPQIAPSIIAQEISTLYDNINLLGEARYFTVITMAHPTENCMTEWNEEVAAERGRLADLFIDAAKVVCKEFFTRAEWADFIDPKTGCFHFDTRRKFTMIEADERYELLGFKRQDVGPCKVIEHPTWGTHSFVTSIFTGAPHDGEYVLELLGNVSKKYKLQPKAKDEEVKDEVEDSDENDDGEGDPADDDSFKSIATQTE